MALLEVNNLHPRVATTGGRDVLKRIRKRVLRELPMEITVAAQKLPGETLEGSVG